MRLAMIRKSVSALCSEGVESCDHKPYFKGEERFADKPSELLNQLEMEEGRDDDFLDMMFLMEDSTISPNALLEDIEPLQDLNGTSSPPPYLLSLSSTFNNGEYVGSVRIPTAPGSKSMPQTPECEDGNGIPNLTLKEDISLEGKSTSDVSSLIIRDLEEDYETATANYSYNYSHSHKELHGMHKRRQKAALYTAGHQAQRRIWGVNSCNDNQKIGTLKLGHCGAYEKINNPRAVAPSTSKAGSYKRGALFTRIWSKSDNIDVMEVESKRCKMEGMSKNLVSERRRRHKLKDKLYSLRALVPNISKMDKASIVADAISYVRELERRVEEVDMEVAHLAAGNGLPATCTFVSTPEDRPAHQVHQHRVVKFTMTNMQDQTYHLQIECKRSIGLWVHLTQAIEALGYDTISANLSRVNEHILNSLIIEVPKEQVLRQEELGHKTMEAMMRFGFVFDIQKGS